MKLRTPLDERNFPFGLIAIVSVDCVARGLRGRGDDRIRRGSVSRAGREADRPNGRVGGVSVPPGQWPTETARSRPQGEPASRWFAVMLSDLDAEAPLPAPTRSAAGLATPWPSDSATNADGRAIAVRALRESEMDIARQLRNPPGQRNSRRRCLPQCFQSSLSVQESRVNARGVPLLVGCRRGSLDPRRGCPSAPVAALCHPQGDPKGRARSA